MGSAAKIDKQCQKAREEKAFPQNPPGGADAHTARTAGREHQKKQRTTVSRRLSQAARFVVFPVRHLTVRHSRSALCNGQALARTSSPHRASYPWQLVREEDLVQNAVRPSGSFGVGVPQNAGCGFTAQRDVCAWSSPPLMDRALLHDLLGGIDPNLVESSGFTLLVERLLSLPAG